MDINMILGTAAGVVGGAIVAPIVLAAYNSFKIGKHIADGAIGLGKLAGRMSAVQVKKIKDKALRDQVALDIKNTPNEFDAAFDAAFDEEMKK